MKIELADVNKAFGGVFAVHGVSLAINSGEMIALLGPSGSGKTTLLRIVAGLEWPDTGDVLFDGRSAASRDVRARQVGFVFQHYALFRHMSVFENVAFGLRVKARRARLRPAEIEAQVESLLHLVQIGSLAQRLPHQLSGGQRQRVALARALAIEPKVLLLDEPFGALDAKVRKELRRWLRHLHDTLGTTSVFVTHDQEEALEIADRVVIMGQGRVEQVGTPEMVYDQPANPFVFRFLGTSNEFDCVVRAGAVSVDNAAVAGAKADGVGDGPARLFARPHDIELVPADGVGARIDQVAFTGPIIRLSVAVAGRAEPIEVDMPKHEYVRKGLKLGAPVRVQIQQGIVFPAEAA